MSSAHESAAVEKRDRRAPRSRLVLVTLCTPLVLSAGCARLLVRAGGSHPIHDAASIVSAGAARERAQLGLRLTLTVRATAGPPATQLASPAYLAIDAPERLRLQVLSPFGVTVLDLANDGDTFTLTLPLKGETRHGHIDLAALAAGTTPEDERMIVALALLFRPKMRPERCQSAGPAAVTCTVAADLVATITVDDALRPVREEYVGPGGRTVLIATLDGYASAARDALPGRIAISDGQNGAQLVVRVVRARRDQGPASSPMMRSAVNAASRATPHRLPIRMRSRSTSNAGRREKSVVYTFTRCTLR